MSQSRIQTPSLESLKLAEHLAILVDKASNSNDNESYEHLVSNLLLLLDGSPEIYKSVMEIMQRVGRNRIRQAVVLAEEVSDLMRNKLRPGDFITMKLSS